MKQRLSRTENRGFSLVEMLVVIAVIGIIAAIAVPTMGAVNDKAGKAKAQRNAQTIATLYNSSRSVGAIYTATDTDGIIDELMAGKTGPALAGSAFRLSLASGEKTLAMEYVAYDAASDLMIYNGAGGMAAAVVSGPIWLAIGYSVDEATANAAMMYFGGLGTARVEFNSDLGVWELQLELELADIPDGFTAIDLDALTIIDTDVT